MLAVQPRLPLVLAQRPRQRSARRPFQPSSQGDGRYRLPRDVQDRLTTALRPFRNRDAAYALALFLARYWSAPNRIVDTFHIDRRALADHSGLDLTEKRIRSAIRALEEIGFLDRTVTSGSRYKPTEEGLRRKPIRFQFGSEYALLFIAANQRAAAGRDRRSEARRSEVLVSSHRASTASAEGQGGSVRSSDNFTKRPKNMSPSERSMNLGQLVKESGIPPIASEPNPRLEAALDRLLQGIRQSRGG